MKLIESLSHSFNFHDEEKTKENLLKKLDGILELKMHYEQKFSQSCNKSNQFSNEDI